MSADIPLYKLNNKNIKDLFHIGHSLPSTCGKTVLQLSADELERMRNAVGQWFSNCASRRPGASFQFSKGVAKYFGFVPLSLGFIASKEL